MIGLWFYWIGLLSTQIKTYASTMQLDVTGWTRTPSYITILNIDGNIIFRTKVPKTFLYSEMFTVKESARVSNTIHPESSLLFCTFSDTLSYV